MREKKISLLKGVKIRKRFEENVIELVYVGVPNLCGHFKDGVLKACDEVSRKKRGRKSKGDTWWWNEEVKKVVSRKKEAYKAMCQNSTEQNNRRCKSMKNKAKKAVSKAMREKTEKALTELQNCPNGIFRQEKGLKTDSKVVGGRCMRGSDGKLCFREKEMSHLEGLYGKDHEWRKWLGSNVGGDAVEGPVVGFCFYRH